MEVKDLYRDKENLDLYAREFWGIEPRSVNPNSKKTSYFASMGTYNWFGFLERINECIEAPRWVQIRSFVEYKCKKRKVSSNPYLVLYNYFEDMGYSSVFKTESMKSLYLNSNDITEINGIYKEIFDFFEK